MKTPRIIIIAGPNGAGKTSFAREFLTHEADCPAFINADLIAAGLSPFQPETVAISAGRLMLQQINANVQARKSFAFETTLSGMSYAQNICQWQALGYHVMLVFLSLDRVETAIDRVAERVRQGGHDVPASVIRRRFTQGWINFEKLYQSRVDSWALYDANHKTPLLFELGKNK